MPTLQELDGANLTSAVREAAQRCVPVAVSIYRDSRWVNLHSRFVALHDQHIIMELPNGQEGECRYEFVPAEKIGLSFKLKHHKHICTVTVAALEQFTLNDGTVAPVLRVCWPTHMHRLQRRAYHRVEVPPNRIVRVSFWLGGKDTEPSGGSPTAQVWSGSASNISAGGLQLKTNWDSVKVLDVGDVLGMRLLFGLGSEVVYTDAQLRHIEEAEGGLLMGFQFLGLGQSRKGQQALKLISAKVAEFQRATSRQPARH